VNLAHVARPGWVAALSEGLAKPVRLDRWLAVRPGAGARQAAVLILAGDASPSKGDDPEILFIERPSTMRTHAGQIAFPGGAADPGDIDLADTALREAAEETGVDRSGIEILGQLPPAHVAVSGFDVTGVVGWWAWRSPVTAVDPREVAAVLVVPVAVLVDPANRARVQHPSGYTGPAFVVDDHLIWGVTAHLLDGVLHLAGWQRPWNHDQVIEIPARYLTGRPDGGGPDAH
jgi:8-oxo-dGTP pyrophosphatase MutT (NUDIX family)